MSRRSEVSLCSCQRLRSHVATAILLIITSTPAVAQQIVSVAQPQFAANSSARVPRDIIQNGHSAARVERLCFHFTIVGGEPAIEELQGKGHLSAIVEWFVEGRVWDRVEVGITQSEWLEDGEKLTAQYKESGTFTWRTFSYVKRPAAGTISLFIRDSIGNILSPLGNPTAHYQPAIVLR